MSREEELKALFLSEALDQSEQLDRLFTALEKNLRDKGAIASIFRLTHTMKANAAALGFAGIAEIAHILEDILGIAKKQPDALTQEIFNDLFRANDKLGELIKAVKTGEQVAYRGILTKLKVIKRSLEEEPQEQTASSQEEATATPEQDAPQQAAAAMSFSDYIQVSVKKLDQLMNLIGELTIERDRLITNAIAQSGKASNEFAALYRITSDLQYAVMSVRLVKVSVLFDKFHRIVRDVANIEGKKVNLELQGTDIEIDRNVLHTISESLVHLVRNAISHGIEMPAQRLEAGKPEAGLIKLVARNDKDTVVIDVIDDGKGIDGDFMRKKAVEKGILSAEQSKALSSKEAIEIIFLPGFSSKDEVSEISGRGVGMDAVKKSIDSIGGELQMQTALGKGSVFSMSLPASMAVKKALLFEVGSNTYALPLTYIESVVQVHRSNIHRVAKGLVATYGDQTMSLVFLNDIFELDKAHEWERQALLQRGLDSLSQDLLYVILLFVEDRLIGLAVDRLIQQKEIIEKPLAHSLGNAKFISGASIMGDGRVCLVVDAPSIARFLFKSAMAVSQDFQN